MQTFLPYESFIESAKVLDNKRLGKQRVEAYQILKTLLQGPFQCGIDKAHKIELDIDEFVCAEGCGVIKKTSWYNHPAVRMWKGHEHHLATYGAVICKEWINRSFKDSLYEKFVNIRLMYPINWPKWIGNENFHASHRSNLLRKDPKHYSKFGWTEPNNLLYFWPTKEGY